MAAGSTVSFPGHVQAFRLKSFQLEAPVGCWELGLLPPLEAGSLGHTRLRRAQGQACSGEAALARRRGSAQILLSAPKLSFLAGLQTS